MAVLVAVARGQRVGLPMAGDGREARAAGARAPRGRAEPVAQVCRSGGHVRGRAGCAGLPGWLLVLAPGRGGSAARLRLHWGPAAPRGALTSAPGALCARSRGPNRAARAPRRRRSLRLPLGPPSERQGARKPEKPAGGWGERGTGCQDLGGADPRPRRELLQLEGPLPS